MNVSANLIGLEGAKALAANTTLTSLDVSDNQIGDAGAKALAANTTLTTLNVLYNQIGDAGAKALAANTTLTTLDVGYNGIGDAGAKALAANTTLTTLNVSINQIAPEGAKALAANTTLTTLDVSANQIGREGAKALAANTTLTTLDVSGNKMGEALENHLKQVIEHNNQQMIRRRDRFLQTLIALAADRADKKSQSLLSQLPGGVMLQIIYFINFRSTESIGKSAQQIKACADFIFNHYSTLKESLAKAHKTQQDFKVIEKISQGKSHFRFFPMRIQQEPPTNRSKQETNENRLDLSVMR